ncbi:MAG: S-methyl-5-thioribose-1-phosphate isomerase [Clostridiales bacterium]|nr:S-methyl-5-thioribose-1-phosphate isomerase [Clostridiales bacterium]
MSYLKGASIGYDTENNRAVFIDQTLLPGEYKEVFTDDYDEMYDAVKTLKVRGAPAIGVFAAICMAVLVNKSSEKDLKAALYAYADDFVKCRPTAVNLKWALDKCKNTAENNEDIKEDLKALALKLIDKDVEICKKIGQYGAELLKDCNTILTHCNAGRLATVRYGTALSPVYVAKEQGHYIKVYADETRPLLQGARLTCFELADAGIDTTLICDNAAGFLMKKGLVDAVMVGCDRVAANGDTANKVGTGSLAVLASYYRIPFYVCMPFSTFDKSLENGSMIPIEERDKGEITDLWYKKRITAERVNVYNPAFDITDHSLITAFITEKGVIRPGEILSYL